MKELSQAASDYTQNSNGYNPSYQQNVTGTTQTIT